MNKPITSDHDAHPFLGKWVRVRLDQGIIAEGKLLGFGDGGDFELLCADGMVYHAWPMLDIETSWEVNDGNHNQGQER